MKVSDGAPAASLRVLLLEDALDDAALVTGTLRAAGVDFHATHVTSGEAFAQALERESFDVVLADFRLPAYNALRALALLKERALDIPFIIVSGAIGEEAAAEAMRAGAHDCIHKDRLVRLAPAVLRELREAERRHEMARAAQQLRWNEALVRTLAEATPFGQYVRDATGQHVVYVNRRFGELWGVAPPPGPLAAAPVPHADVASRCGAALAAGTAFAEGWHPGTPIAGGVEEELRLGDGRWLRHLRAPVRDGAGGLLAWLHLFEDITARKRTEAQLLLAERMMSLGTVAAGVAHEVNTPLAYILGNLRYLRAQLEGAGSAARPLGDASEVLHECEEGVEHVTRIVRELKAFSRLEDAPAQDVDLAHELRSAIRMARAEVLGRATLVQDLRELPPVHAQPGRLAQVFLNLLVNAAQAFDGQPSRGNTIWLAARTDGRGAGTAVVEVRDNGPGISEAALPHIFDAFFTTKPAGTGTGLGLSVCQRIVAELGGSLDVESSPGQGATFRVRLPAASAEPHGTLAAPRPSRRARILVVDDNARFARSLQRLLEPHYDVLIETSPRTALRRLAGGERVDAILCDLTMPELDGTAFLAALAAQSPTLARRLAFVSGGALSAPARNALASGQVPHLDKPFSLENLEQLLATLLSSP